MANRYKPHMEPHREPARFIRWRVAVERGLVPSRFAFYRLAAASPHLFVRPSPNRLFLDMERFGAEPCRASDPATVLVSTTEGVAR